MEGVRLPSTVYAGWIIIATILQTRETTMPVSDKNPFVPVWMTANSLGILFAVWAGVSFGKFDSNLPLFC